MKTMSKLLFVGMVILLSCTKETMNPASDPVTVTMPFSATYKGYNTLTDQNQAGCIPGFNHTVEIADGNGSFVGFSTFHSDYCSNISTLNPGLSFIKAQNGDTVFLAFSGMTCVGLGENGSEADDHINELCCWEIPFTILGGTGAFEGAMGSGTTDDYLCASGGTYNHSWQGTITVRRAQLQEIIDIK